MQQNGPLLFVMQQDIISVFNIISQTNTEIYNISNITPTQIITNLELQGSLLFINNQTQLLIYYCLLTKAYLIQSISISILNPRIIMAQEYLYISNSTVQKTYYIYNCHSIQLINQESGNYTGQYYFNPYFKFYVQFSSSDILSIFQNSGQNNQLFKSIQLNSSIEQVSLTYFDKNIIINFLQNQSVVTYIIDQQQKLIVFPEVLNYNQITVNYQINASNEFNFSILSSQLIVVNSGIVIFDNSQDLQQLNLTNQNQSFLLDPSFLKGQISNFQFNCSECEDYNVIQQYQINNIDQTCQWEVVDAMPSMCGTHYIYNISQQQCELFQAYSFKFDRCYQLYYFSNLDIIIQFCNEAFNIYYVITFPNSTYSKYNISQQPTNVQIVDQFNAAFIQQSDSYQIQLYQITLAKPIFEQLITTESQIVSYTVGGSNYIDHNYMVLMYFTEDQYLFINLYSVTLSEKQYNYSLLNTTTISVSNLIEKYLIDGMDIYGIQIVQIIMDNQYILCMQTIITTKYYYSYSININLLIQSPDYITTQLKCLIPPYGNWEQFNQINANNKTLILVYGQGYQYLIALYDLNQCENQRTLNFSIGIPKQNQLIYSDLQLSLLLYSNQSNDADLFQSNLMLGEQSQVHYSFTKDIEITIQSSNKMKHNQSVYLIASNHFMQYNMKLYLIDDVPQPQPTPEPTPVVGPIIAWWAWLLISLGVVLIVSVTSLLLIKKKQQKREEPLLEMK